MAEQPVLTISQLNGWIKDVLNTSFSSGVWVCGEIQGYNRNRDRAHVFFELCEKDERTKDIVARIGLVIFSGRKAFIEGTLKSSENAFELKDDIEVKFYCKVDFYPPHGAVRLIVEGIDPTYTLGKIAQEKQRLIALLKDNGTLDRNKLCLLPEVPLRLGLITAHDSAAYNDFISELQSSGYGFKVFVRDTVMQGKSSPRDVSAALLELSRLERLDAIVITRGGGSIADLSCFDDRALAEAIAICPLPVLSGIGHEINITITDLAAHTYQKTPTAIAQFLSERVRTFMNSVEERVSAVVNGADDVLRKAQRRLKGSALDLRARTDEYLKQHHLDLARRQEFLKVHPLQTLRAAEGQVKARRGELERSLALRFKEEENRLEQAGRLLDMASPARILRRGFSITRFKDGRLLRTARGVKAGAVIVTELPDGRIESVVGPNGGTK